MANRGGGYFQLENGTKGKDLNPYFPPKYMSVSSSQHITVIKRFNYIKFVTQYKIRQANLYTMSLNKTNFQFTFPTADPHPSHTTPLGFPQEQHFIEINGKTKAGKLHFAIIKYNLNPTPCILCY